MDSENETSRLGIIQICHGPVIPEFISAYSLRCNSLLSDANAKIFSVGGPILKDSSVGNASQFRSILLTLYSVLKGNRSFEIFLSKGTFLRKTYLSKIRAAIGKSSVVVFEGPWQYLLVKDILKDKLVIYDAHNSETNLRKGNMYEADTEFLERSLVKRSDIVFSVTRSDLTELMKFDESHLDKFYLVPHVLPSRKVDWRGLSSKEISFIGSMYGPNISALNFLLELARELPSFHFNVMGNVRTGFHRKKLPNVTYHGVVDNEKKTSILLNSMLALNPVSEGSGRNVKMVDYLLHAVPVISTSIGIRGFEQYDVQEKIIVVEREGFLDKIEYLDRNRDKLKVLSTNSRNIYEKILENEVINTPSKVLMETVSHKEGTRV